MYLNTIDFNDIIKIHYHNVSGSAIHKTYAVSDSKPVSDKSKNHFYTDLSINKCNAPLNIGFISENVMCDNVFGTDLRYLVHLSAASNCIVANSSLTNTVERQTFKRPNAQNPKQIDTVNPNLGLYVHSACSCWFQNSYLKTNGRQRTCAYETEDAFYHAMSIKDEESTDDNFVDKRHMRAFIGAGFDIPNHWFKFTGCDMESTYGTTDFYFYESYYSVVDPKASTHPDPCKSQYGEYWDNCSFETTTDQVIFRMYCSNDLPGGLTIRNSYLKNTRGTNKPPFRQCCIYATCEDSNQICPIKNNCVFAKHEKTRVWTRFENDIFKNICRNDKTNWQHLVTYDTNIASISNAVNMSNSYGSDCYKISEGNFLPIVFTY